MVNLGHRNQVVWFAPSRLADHRQRAKDGIQLSVIGQLRWPIEGGSSWLEMMISQPMFPGYSSRMVAGALIAVQRADLAAVLAVDQEAVLLVALAVVLADHLADRSMSLLSPIASVVLHLERQEILTAKRS
jgi:hypothetical protein